MVSTRKQQQPKTPPTSSTSSTTTTNTTTTGTSFASSSTHKKKRVFSPDKPRSNGLAPHQKKQLVLDIEESAGGISNYLSGDSTAITRLLEKRPDLFPDKESREKAGSFVRSLRKLAKEGQYYDRVLKPLQIPKNTPVLVHSGERPSSPSLSSSSEQDEEISQLSKNFSRHVNLSPQVLPAYSPVTSASRIMSSRGGTSHNNTSSRGGGPQIGKEPSGVKKLAIGGFITLLLTTF
jgi:hypothetical protein